MSITASNYAYTPSTNSVPRLSVNVQAATIEELNTAIIAYDTSVTAYKNSYSFAINTRDYVLDRLEKDACTDNGLATVDKVANTYLASIKANEYFATAKDGKDTTSASGITAILASMAALKTAFFDDETVPGSTGTWDVSKKMPSATYDTKAVVVSNSVLTEESGNTNFLIDIPKNTGNARTFTAFQLSGQTLSAKYTITRGGTGWVLKNSSNVAIKETTDIDASPVVWTDPSN